MPAPYNLTNLTSSNDMTGFFIVANETTEGVFGWFIIIILFAVIFMSFKQNYPTPQAFAGTSFIVTILAMLLKTFGIVSNLTMYLLILASAIGMVTLFLQER